MPTNYPSALDTIGSTLPDNKANSTLTVDDHASHHNNIADAIIAIETILGTSPAGAYSTIRDAVANKVDLTPGTSQVILPSADVVGLTIKQHNVADASNLFETRLSTNALVAYIDKTGVFSAQALKIAGTALASTHLSDSAALARLAGPTFTGTPAAPTAAPGTNTTQLATTAFVTAAVGSVSTTAGTSGLLSARPSAASASGLFFYATDQNVLFFSDGSSWQRMSVPAGTLVDWMQPGSVLPTGWVAYDGSVLPGSTGIYADLYAHLGNTTTLPDTRGRMTVAKGTHADVSTIGNNDGTTLANRRPKHQHTVYDPGHLHSFQLGNVDGTPGNSATRNNNPQQALNTATNTTGIRVNPEGASSSSSPQDAPAYIVTLKIAKL